MAYNSEFMNSLFQNDPLSSPISETFYVKENLLGGSSVVDLAGNPILDTMPNAAGGETVNFANGETGHLKENIEGDTTLDMPGIENDIHSRPGIFDQEYFYQNGESIGTMQPNFMGDGVDFVAPAGGTVFSTSNSPIADAQIQVDSSLLHTEGANLQNSFSDIEAISNQFSGADLASASDSMDALDVLEFL